MNKDPLLPDKIYYPEPNFFIRVDMENFDGQEQEVLTLVKNIQLYLEKLGLKPFVRIVNKERYLNLKHDINCCFVAQVKRWPWVRECKFIGSGINILKICELRIVLESIDKLMNDGVEAINEFFCLEIID